MCSEQQNQLDHQHLYLNNISSNNKAIQQQLRKKELKRKMMEKMIRMFPELIIPLITQVYKSVQKSKNFLNTFKDINLKKLTLIQS
jgi:hypothetical protein